MSAHRSPEKPAPIIATWGVLLMVKWWLIRDLELVNVLRDSK